MPSDHTLPLDRRDFLGGLTLTAAAAFTLSVPEEVAAQVTQGSDDPVQTLTSPDGSIEVTVDVQDGSPTYRVTKDGATVVGESSLGFEFKNQSALADGLAVTGSQRSSTDETWTPVWDQYDEIHDAHEELRMGLEESGDPGRSLTLAVRAFDDGVAFRYVFPEDSGLGDFVITAERSEFAFEGDHTAWWIRNDYNSYEYAYQQTALSEIGSASPTGGTHTPITMETDEGQYLSVHEADLVDYAAMGLRPTGDGTTLEAELAPLPDGTKVTASAPHRTPWRTIQIADRPGALIESNLIVNCNEPIDPEAFPHGTDWIEPGKFIGIWWLMITGRAKWQYLGPESGNHAAQTGRMKQYMDFASAHGIRSVLVEGWNVGWDSYPGNGDTMDFDEPYPDFDIQAVTDYGRSLDPPVEMTAHNETAGNVANYESQLRDTPNPFAEYDDLGIHSVKTGYVADSGMSFDGAVYNHHCQVLVNHHHHVYREAAKHRQMLEIHEPVKPTGERRRFPNVMTKEGVKGQEYDSFGYVDPSHHVTIPFTRMLAGPVEYTPGLFDMDSGSGGIETTRAKQLAMYPTYLSGLHMVADLPSSYLADQPATLSVGEVAQAEFAESEDFEPAARWSNAQGERYVPIDRTNGDTGSSLTWTVEDVPEAGEYDVHVRYASYGGSNRHATLDAGGEQTRLTFPQTAYWDAWDSVRATVTLDSGANTLALKLANGDVGGINVDSIAVTETGREMPEPETPPITGPTDEAFQFVEDVPAAGWDDTRVLDAEIGEYTVTARAKGDEWFVGVMTGTDGRVLDVPLSFLGDGTYVAQLYSDGAEAAYDTNLADVRVDEVLVDAETTLVASLVESGGMAARVRPATEREHSDLPAYERPSQSVSVDVNTSVLVQQRFVDVSVSNDGSFIGGTLLELLVDGDVVERRNVRAAPGETATISLSKTFGSEGTYDVAVRTTDGSTLASESVTAIQPQSVAGFLDPLRDDNGPGSYTYPTGDDFRDGAFDLRFVSLKSTPETYRIRFQVDTLYDARDSTNGFSPHAFVLWIHDPSASGGRTSGRDDLRVTADFEKPWHYRLVLSGSTTRLVGADGSTILDGSAIETSVDVDNGNVTAVVERSAFDGDATAFSIVAGVHAMTDGALLPVQPEAGPATFGGAESGAAENAPRLCDVLTTESVEQSDALSYSASDRATLPFVPLDEPNGGSTTTTMSPTGTPDGTTTTTGSGGGSGFGVVTGALGTAGGIAYGLKSHLKGDTTTDENDE
ncbi:MAG: glycoside hydrolase family 97 catalytic domain-containing protein [Halapricum sp.]